MKDLKHLIYFEKLLEDANNELVRQAQAEGKLALGYTCYHLPEVLLNVDNCFSVRLRAPNASSLDISSYYMSNYTCLYARALVERGIEGGYQFLDALIGVDACSMMNRAMEHMEVLKVNDKEKFFVTHCDIPFKTTDYCLDSYVKQMRLRVLDRLTEVYGVDTSDAAIRKAVEEHNEVCKIISEIDDPTLTKLIEDAGALIVVDRFCFGSTPGREVIELTDDEDALTQICRQYMAHSQCARYMEEEKVLERRNLIDRLAKEYKADGIIYEQMKYCDYWGFERALVSHIMNEEYGWPVLSIDRMYVTGVNGQLRTRCQAFVESLEIKRIHNEEGTK